MDPNLGSVLAHPQGHSPTAHSSIVQPQIPAQTHSCKQCININSDEEGSQTGLSIFRSLPTELALKILEEMILPPKPCNDYIFGRCNEPWSCKKGSHDNDNDVYAHLPCPTILNLIPNFSIDGTKYFFKHNTFVFNQDHALFPLPPRHSAAEHFGPLLEDGTLEDRTYQYRFSQRDPRAQKLLRFTDHQKPPSPVWLPHIGRIQYMIIKPKIDINWPDWDWPLRIDNTCVPNLKYLHLDLSTYSKYTNNAYMRKLEVGAQNLKSLKLKELVLEGLCSQRWVGNEQHKKWVSSLFERGLAEDGTIVFVDTHVGCSGWESCQFEGCHYRPGE